MKYYGTDAQKEKMFDHLVDVYRNIARDAKNPVYIEKMFSKICDIYGVTICRFEFEEIKGKAENAEVKL